MCSTLWSTHPWVQQLPFINIFWLLKLIEKNPVFQFSLKNEFLFFQGSASQKWRIGSVGSATANRWACCVPHTEVSLWSTWSAAFAVPAVHRSSQSLPRSGTSHRHGILYFPLFLQLDQEAAFKGNYKTLWFGWYFMEFFFITIIFCFISQYPFLCFYLFYYI